MKKTATPGRTGAHAPRIPTHAQHKTPLIPGEPEGKSWGTSFVILYTLAFLGVWVALMTPINMTLALRLEALDPGNKKFDLAVILGAGAVFATLINPLVGQLSDRTVGRFGMRRPWVIGGTAVGAVGLFLVAVGGFPVMVAGWCLTQIGFNAILAALVPLLADQVPGNRRGMISGLLGICLPMGNVVGIYLADIFKNSSIGMFMVPMAFCAVLLVLFMINLKDRTLAPAQLKRLGLREFMGNFIINPKTQPDFAWAFGSRFMFYIGMSTLMTYEVYYLIEKFHYSESQIPGLMLTSMLVNSATAVAGSLIVGWLSDYFDRRKIFVAIAAGIFAIGLGVVGAATTFPMLMVGIGLAGLGSGTYFAVDLALVTEVLPHPDFDAAKDMGIFNLASALPQSIAPMLAPFFLAIGSGGKDNNYTALFIAASIAVIIGAVAVLPITKAK